MLKLPDPELQVDFTRRLGDIRKTYLQNALMDTVRHLSVPLLDRELATLVPAKSLALLAARGMRGELFFPLPSLVSAAPRLLGYYRLLYGFSQKEFYGSETGFSLFKPLEERGVISERARNQLEPACKAMIEVGEVLLASMNGDQLTPMLLDDLTLLTLGPQLRGGANVQRGTAGIRAVFGIIHEIVRSAIVQETKAQITIKNAAGRLVKIQFASDPDIYISEEMRGGSRELIAIEVKAGSDFSNIHNRLGEAEKSHQKARARGFTECWTVLNVDRTNFALAKTESPSTDRFYRISDLLRQSGEAFDDFADRVVSLTGISTDP